MVDPSSVTLPATDSRPTGGRKDKQADGELPVATPNTGDMKIPGVTQLPEGKSGNSDDKGSLNIRIHLNLHAKVHLDLDAQIYGDVVIGLL